MNKLAATVPPRPRSAYDGVLDYWFAAVYVGVCDLAESAATVFCILLILAKRGTVHRSSTSTGGGGGGGASI